MRALPVLLLLLVATPSAAARALDEEGATASHGWWDWTTIVAGEVALGGGELDAEEVAYAASQGFGAVLSMREEYEDDLDALAAHDLHYLRIPLGDAEHDTLDPVEMQAALDFIDREVGEGRAVFVHCHAGWHRSAAVVAAWLMVRDGTDADIAWKKLDALRPGAEPRWIDSVYAYHAWREGKPKLEVDVHVGAISPAVGDRVEMEAVVTLGGVPYAGAEVHLEADYDGLERDGVTGPDGRASFTFEFDGSKRQYVHALARAPGLVAGYDRATMYGDRSRVEPGPFTFKVEGGDAVAEGDDATLSFTAANADGKARNVRVTVGDGERTLWRGYIGRDGRENATFAVPDGARTLHVRATSPYADTSATEFGVAARDVGKTPAETETTPEDPASGGPADDAEGEPREDAARESVGVVTSRNAPATGVLALVAVAAAACAARRR